MLNFWTNWQWRKTSWPNGIADIELRFFGNLYDHVERTAMEAVKRLRLSEFGIEPCKGGGFECVITYQIEEF